MSAHETAIEELRRAGLYDADSDYGGMLGKAVEELLRVFAAQGHSGFSAHQTLHIFGAVARGKTLGPLTSAPDEWMCVSEMSGRPMWQSRRAYSCFSDDGGVTFYDIDERQAWWRRALPRRAPLRWRLRHRRTIEPAPAPEGER